MDYWRWSTRAAAVAAAFVIDLTADKDSNDSVVAAAAYCERSCESSGYSFD